jgi:hypothetical protein
MDIRELKDRLNAECYNPQAVYVGPDWHRYSDRLCLTQENMIFKVFYVERGQKGTILGIFQNENEACDFFYEQISSDKWYSAHCLGLYEKEADAITLANLLQNSGIKDVYRDVIPHSKPYRVFVFGTDLIKAKGVLEKFESR